MKVNHTIVLMDGNTIIIQNNSAEFGTNYELYHEQLPNSLQFGTLERALEHIKFLDKTK